MPGAVHSQSTRVSPPRPAVRRRFLLLVLAVSIVWPGRPGWATAVRHAAVYDDGKAHGAPPADPDPALVYRSWPFCPTDRIPCSDQNLAWLELGVAIDAYSARRNDSHDSIARIIETTRRDFEPLAAALRKHFEKRDVASDARRAAFVHGLVQAVLYDFDTTTGWTEYPKFGIEFFVDEQGDCDDAAIATTMLLAALGYDSWFVGWTSATADHLSTAISRDRGDLRTFTLPEGSRWVPGIDGEQLLHVDGTGNPSGCGQARINCSRLGTNDWHLRGLEVSVVVAASDPDIETAIPISAWNNGGLDRPNRTFVDRRSVDDKALEKDLLFQDPWEDRVRQRLSRLGIDAQNAEMYLRNRTGSGDEFFYLFIIFCFGIIGIFGGMTLRRRFQRLRRRRHAQGSGTF